MSDESTSPITLECSLRCSAEHAFASYTGRIGRHGLRLENRYDGTHETQAPIPVGVRFTYRVRFPDPGLYWYHPHVREDYGQELGVYGNILVVPAEADARVRR